MTEAALALAVVIGVLLGALGGGGSILTVPVLMYAAGFDPKQAIAMSLPVVALTSAVGALSHWRSGHVQLRPALVFGAVAMAGAYVGARIGTRVPASSQLILLGVVMIVAAVVMLRSSAPIDAATGAPRGAPHPAWSAVIALGIGMLTGLIGIGGGFLFVPVLVLLADVPVHDAIGTSLVVIAMNAVAGLAGYIGAVTIPWTFVWAFAALASGGALLGVWVSRRTPPRLLQQAFAVLLLATAAVMLWRA